MSGPQRPCSSPSRARCGLARPLLAKGLLAAPCICGSSRMTSSCATGSSWLHCCRIILTISSSLTRTSGPSATSPPAQASRSIHCGRSRSSRSGSTSGARAGGTLRVAWAPLPSGIRSTIGRGSTTISLIGYPTRMHPAGSLVRCPCFVPSAHRSTASGISQVGSSSGCTSCAGWRAPWRASTPPRAKWSVCSMPSPTIRSS